MDNQMISADVHANGLSNKKELTDDEILDLIAQSRDESLSKEKREAAKNKAIEARLPLVVKNAHYFHRCTLDIADKIGYGQFGLLNAVARYDLSSKTPFNAYASSCIKTAIRDGLSSENMIKLPHNVLQDYLHSQRESSSSQGDGGLSAKKFDKVRLCSDIASLDSPLQGDSGFNIVDTIPDENNRSADDVLQRNETISAIHQAIKTLPQDEQKIIDLLFFSDPKDAIIKNVAEKMGITVGNATKLRESALFHLYHNKEILNCRN